MGCDASYFEPLPCPKCGKKPIGSVWEHRFNGNKIRQLGCCGLMARGQTKQKVEEKWNEMVLEYTIRSYGERRNDG